MLKRLTAIARRSQFEPGLLSLFVNPFYFARAGLYRNIKALAGHVTGKVLDVGCGQKPYEYLFPAGQYIGLELDTPENRLLKRADCFYAGRVFPFSDGYFDSVVINQVFEHIFTPDEFLGEVRRILKPGGVLLLTVPFLWDEHEQPHDYVRYTSFGIRSLLERNGFEVREQRKSVADARVVFQMINVYIYKKIVTRFSALNVLLTVLLMMPWNLAGELAGFILPHNDDLYLDNVVLARKVPHA